MKNNKILSFYEFVNESDSIKTITIQDVKDDTRGSGSLQITYNPSSREYSYVAKFENGKGEFSKPNEVSNKWDGNSDLYNIKKSDILYSFKESSLKESFKEDKDKPLKSINPKLIEKLKQLPNIEDVEVGGINFSNVGVPVKNKENKLEILRIKTPEIYISLNTDMRGPRTDHGGGRDGDSWLSSDKIQELKYIYAKKLDKQIKEIKKLFPGAEVIVDYGEKGHVSIGITITDLKNTKFYINGVEQIDKYVLDEKGNAVLK